MRFDDFWKNHPTVSSSIPDNPCSTGKVKNFENQCAIRLGVALEKSGVDTRSFDLMFPKRRCWHHKPGHILAAEELAHWIQHSGKFGMKETYAGGKAFDAIHARRGIVFFKDYYGPGNTGDHIDLWNGARLTALDTWMRIHARLGSFGLHSLGFGSDFEKSASIWFWPVP